MKPIRGQYERYRAIFKGVRMPFAFIDLDNLDKNVDAVARTQVETGKAVRIHSKSIRCLPLIKHVQKRGGGQFRGVMGFSVEEARFLSENGIDDLIVAYPTVQPTDLQILADMTKAGVDVSLMTDSADHLRILSDYGEQHGCVLKACLELDVAYRPLGSSLHLGMRRSPVRTEQDLRAFIAAAKDLGNVQINAVMGYEGHIAGLNDAVPGERLKNSMIRLLKFASIREFTPRRGEIVRLLRKAGMPVTIVNGGGSGSLVSTGQDPCVTEVTAGSAFYASALFWHYRDVSYVPSAFFALQVVRKPRADMVTCQGGGYPASGPPGQDRLPVPVYPDGMRLIPLEGAGEVQTPMQLPADAPALSLGDPVFFQHAKAGELAERFNEFHLVRGGKIVDKVLTYRGMGKAFI